MSKKHSTKSVKTRKNKPTAENCVNSEVQHDVYAFETQSRRNAPTEFEINNGIEKLSRIGHQRRNKGIIYQHEINAFFSTFMMNEVITNQIILKLVRDKNITVAADPIGQENNINEIKSLPTQTELLNDPSKQAMLLNVGSRLLTANEEKELFKMIQEGDPNKKRYAIGKLIFSNLRLITKSGQIFSGKGVSDLQDLLQEGIKGMFTALSKFDWKLNFKLSTYATFWIRQAMQRAVIEHSRTIKIPVHLNDSIHKMNLAETQLENEKGRKPTIQELSTKLGMTENKIAALKKYAVNPGSIERHIGEDKESTFGDFTIDNDSENPQDKIESAWQNKKVMEFLRKNLVDHSGDKVKIPELDIICRRLGIGEDKDGNPINDPQTLEQIAQYYGVTRERVRQLEQKAMRKLKHPSKSKYLIELLNK